MNPQEYANMFHQEQRHWWYRGMWRISAELLKRHCGPPWGGWRVLDAGCGTGGVLARLAPYGRAYGADYSPRALDFARRRTATRLARASVDAVPFRDASFDLVTSFDVLCHRAVADAGGAVGEFARVLKPGGWLLLRLPAYDWLRSEHDAFVHTRHRFTAAEVDRLVRDAGLRLRRLTYANTLAFAPIVARRLLGQLANGAHSDVGPVPTPLNAALGGLLGCEARWLREHDLPFGLTVIALARKEGRRPSVDHRARRAAGARSLAATG